MKERLPFPGLHEQQREPPSLGRALYFAWVKDGCGYK